MTLFALYAAALVSQAASVQPVSLITSFNSPQVRITREGDVPECYIGSVTVTRFKSIIRTVETCEDGKGYAVSVATIDAAGTIISGAQSINPQVEYAISGCADLATRKRSPDKWRSEYLLCLRVMLEHHKYKIVE